MPVDVSVKIPILSDPDDMIAVAVNRMAGAIILLHACYAFALQERSN